MLDETKPERVSAVDLIAYSSKRLARQAPLLVCGDLSVECLDLSKGLIARLKHNVLYTINDVCNLSRRRLKTIPNMGKKSIQRIEAALADFGVALAEDERA